MAVGLTALGNSTVRVLAQDGAYAGLGYRYAPDLVITCAHVVAAALGADPRDHKAPAGKVLLDVPFAFGDKAEEQVAATLVPGGWLPLRDGNQAADLALLRVQDAGAELPLPGPLAGLDPAISLVGKELAAYGGPQGHDRHLILLEGRVLALIGNGRWQLSARDSVYPIKPGCSGAPAIDTGTGVVIGLIAQDEQDPSVPAGFLVPAERLRALLTAAGFPRSAVPGLKPLRNWLDAHLAPALPALADPVRRFVDYYAGVPERPIPFAGREEVLAELDRRFAEGGRAFQLVSGAAGIGKSALLLHWTARQLREEPGLRLLFVPISTRFDTAGERTGLRLLHAQLAALFAEVAFPEGVKPDHEDYRDRIAAGWQAIAERPSERFLLVVDGADEASGPWLETRILPYQLPPNLTLVLAARNKPGQSDGCAWLEAFPVAPDCRVAEPLELDPLGREAVGEAIVQLGHPLDDLPGREGVLDALYTLTDRGDPLLVGLWAGQLWKSRGQLQSLNAANLARLRPGYEGFVEVWLEEQTTIWRACGTEADQLTLQRLLWVLALARGPLRLRDWLAVANRLPSGVLWDEQTARKVFDSAYRLIVGDAESGYAFVHPRLADHFQAELAGIKEERQAAPRAYLDWGAATVAALNDGTLSPDQCPTYLLRHYSAHVLAVGLSPDQALDQHLLPLLGEGWMRAWEEEEGAYGAYLADVQRVRKTLRKSNEIGKGPPYRIGGEIRCALIQSSIRSLTENLSPELIAALAESGVWTLRRAIRVANGLSKQNERVYALALLAGQGSTHRNQEVLTLAFAASRDICDEFARARTLMILADQLPAEERRAVLREALAVARDTENEYRRAAVLATAAERSGGEPELLVQALEVARAIECDKGRAEALAAVAGQLAGDERHAVLVDALAAARLIWVEESRAEALAAVAGQLAGEPGLLDEALAAARLIKVEESRAKALAAVAGQLAGDERRVALTEALAAARLIKVEESRAKALAAVVAPLAGEDRRAVLGEALAVARGIEYGTRPRDEALAAVAGQLAGEPGLRSEALAAARGIEPGWYRAKALAVVAGQLVGEDRRAVLGEALEAASGIKDERFRARALAAVADELTGADRRAILGDAVAATRRIEQGSSRADALEAVAGHSAGESWLLSEMLAATRGIEQGSSRTKALAAVADQLAGEDRRAVLDDALASARSIEDGSSRVYALATVAERLAGERRRTVLGETLAAAHSIERGRPRAEALAAVAMRFAGEDRRTVLDAALASARTSVLEEFHSEALAAVAGQLAGDERRVALTEALAAARLIKDERFRARALAAVADELTGDPALLGEALEIARSIVDEELCAKASAAVTRQLLGDERRAVPSEALAAARSIEDEGRRAEALVALAGQLAGAPVLLAEALAAAGGIENELLRAEALAAVTGQLEGEPALVGEALAAARGIRWEWVRVKALTAVARQLAQTNITGPGKPSVAGYGLLASVISAGRHLERKNCLWLIEFLVPIIAALGGPAGARETADAIRDVGGWWP